MKRTFAVITVLAVAVAVIMLSGYDTLSAETANNTTLATRRVKVVTVKQGSFTLPFHSTGHLEPVRESHAAPKISGVVAEVHVEIGSRVKAGDPLFTFDNTYHKLDLERAEAAIAVAKAQLEDTLAGTREEDLDVARKSVELAKIGLAKAERDFARVSELFERGSVSQSDFDDAKSGLENAQLAVRLAETNLRKAEAGATATQIAILRATLATAEQAAVVARQMLTDCVVRAPFGGVITEKKVDPGSHTAPGDPHMRILDDSELRFALGVPERYASYVKAGLPIELHFDGTQINRTVDFVVPRVNPANRTITCYVNIDNSENHLPANLFGEAMLSIEASGLLVPTSAIVYRGEDPYLVTVADGKAKLVQVRPGISSGTMIAVSGEIADGTQVVSEMGADIQDGLPLEIAN